MSLQTAFNEDNLHQLVRSFYGRVREDPLLGPVFQNTIGSDPDQWEPHLRTMTDFWTTVMLQRPAYKGNPVTRHLAVEGIEPAHFQRWLALFEEVARELYDEQASTYIVGRSRKMGRHLTQRLFGTDADHA